MKNETDNLETLQRIVATAISVGEVLVSFDRDIEVAGKNLPSTRPVRDNYWHLSDIADALPEALNHEAALNGKVTMAFSHVPSITDDHAPLYDTQGRLWSTHVGYFTIDEHGITLNHDWSGFRTNRMAWLIEILRPDLVELADRLASLWTPAGLQGCPRRRALAQACANDRSNS